MFKNRTPSCAEKGGLGGEGKPGKREEPTSPPLRNSGRFGLTSPGWRRHSTINPSGSRRTNSRCSNCSCKMRNESSHAARYSARYSATKAILIRALSIPTFSGCGRSWKRTLTIQYTFARCVAQATSLCHSARAESLRGYSQRLSRCAENFQSPYSSVYNEIGTPLFIAQFFQPQSLSQRRLPHVSSSPPSGPTKKSHKTSQRFSL